MRHHAFLTPSSCIIQLTPHPANAHMYLHHATVHSPTTYCLFVVLTSFIQKTCWGEAKVNVDDFGRAMHNEVHLVLGHIHSQEILIRLNH